jgi:pimeloyl-ACP methyl ester carboxylesterase
MAGRGTLPVADTPPIVLIHGACSQPAHFDAWRDFFSDAGYRCIVPALPGHAPSSRAVLRRQGFGDYVDAMRAVVAGLGAPPIVIGHSMGGLIARVLAAEGRCAGVVLVAPLPAGRVPAPAGALPWYAAVAPFVLAGRPFRPWPGAVRRLALHTLPRAEQDAIAAGFVAESGRAYRDLVLGRAKVKRRGIRCPMLVLHGDIDRQIPLAVARGIAEKHGAPLTVIRGQGHWLIAPSLTALIAPSVVEWLRTRGR